MTIRLAIGHFLLVVLWNQPLSLTISDIFNGECDAMVGMTLNALSTNVKHFGTNRFFTYDFLLVVNNNFWSRTHRLSTIHTLQATKGRNIVA